MLFWLHREGTVFTVLIDGVPYIHLGVFVQLSNRLGGADHTGASCCSVLSNSSFIKLIAEEARRLNSCPLSSLISDRAINLGLK